LDKFRLRLSDFIGIILPGIIFLLNIYLIFKDELNIYTSTIFSQNSTIKEVGLFFVLIVISYVIGSAFRIFKTILPDYFSRKMRTLVIKVIIVFFKISGKSELVKNYSGLVRRYKEPFPYYIWYKEGYLNCMPTSIKSIFEKHINEMYQNVTVSGTDLSSNKKRLYFGKDKHKSNNHENEKALFQYSYKYHRFINFCKIEVFNYSSLLSEEILFAEGLSRMFCGMVFATFFSILLAISIIVIPIGIGSIDNSIPAKIFIQKKTTENVLPGKNEKASIIIDATISFDTSLINKSETKGISPNNQLHYILIINFVCFLIFLWGVHHLRFNEAVTIFEAYAVVKSNDYYSPLDKLFIKRNIRSPRHYRFK
jgi:hypothetical protein